VANTFSVETNDLPQYLNNKQDVGASNPVVAEPLHVSDITVPGNSNCNPCDMVIAVTLNGTVFAWIANGPNVGTQLWSRQGSGQTQGQNSLPVDDCGNGMAGRTIRPVDWGMSNSLPFAGIVGTPVIDLSPSGSTTPSATPVMFVTSWCQDNSAPTPVRQWWLHELNLTTGADYVTPYNIVGETSPSNPLIYANGWLNADDIDSNGHIPFIAKYQMQRPALLEVKDPNVGSSPNHLIYIGLGTGTYEKSAGNKGYHGWVLAFTTDQNGNISPVSTSNGPNAFVTTPLGCGTIQTGQNCDGYYNPSSYGKPACNCLTPTGYQTTVNFGGHGAGIWSARALAATTWNALGDGSAHIFANTGNGGFQNQVAATGQEPNLGDSLVDFEWPGGTPASMQPAQAIAPYGGPLVCGSGDYCDMTSSEFPQCHISGLACQPCSATTNPPCNPAIQPMMPDGAAPDPASGIYYSVELLSANDWDATAGPIMVFNDLNGQPKVVTASKPGYGYIADPSNFCNPNGGSSGCAQAGSTNVSFAAGDPGYVFIFGAAQNPCPDLPTNLMTTDCDRATSFAFYNNSIYYWAYRENLVALGLSNSSASSPISGVGTVTTCGTPPCSITTSNPNWGHGATSTYPLVYGTPCSAGCPCTTGSCFTGYLVAGDQLSFTNANSQTQTVTITDVIDDVNLAVSPGFSVNAPSTGSAFNYWGYLVKAGQDRNPPSNALGYPGGSVQITSNGGTNAVVWAIAPAASSNGKTSGEPQRTQGVVLAYYATPNTDLGGGVLNQLFSSAQIPTPPVFCASSFALPAVANGTAFIPTYANPPSTPACPPFEAAPGTTPFASGIFSLRLGN
jgi:hypothetical protein